MAPPTRNRSRKPGLKRMDAAVDALTPMGFPPDLVRRKVRELLKLYDGDGWVFIEEAAYKLLIESILEDQEGTICEKGETSCRDSQDENACEDGLEAQLVEMGPSNEDGGEPLCLDQGKELESSSIDDAPLPPLVAGFEQCLPMHLDYQPRRRKPCLGWMGGREDDNNYVLLNPLPVIGWSSRERPCERKSRWDEKPDDLV